MDTLKNNFGKSGEHFFKIIRSIQDNPVNPNRMRKSIGAERTFSQNIDSEGFMLDKLDGIAVELEKRIVQSGNKGKTITVKIKYNDFTQQTRSKTINDYLQAKEEFFPIIEELLYQKEIKKSVRLLGISITNLYQDNLLPKEEFSVQLKFDL